MSASHGWIVAAYWASAACETLGIALVVVDIALNRRRAKRVLAGTTQVYSGSRIRFPGISERRIREQDSRELHALKTNTERSDRFTRAVLVEILRGSWWQPAGPILVVLGIAVGLWANLASLSP